MNVGSLLEDKEKLYLSMHVMWENWESCGLQRDRGFA